MVLDCSTLWMLCLLCNSIVSTFEQLNNTAANSMMLIYQTCFQMHSSKKCDYSTQKLLKTSLPETEKSSLWIREELKLISFLSKYVYKIVLHTEINVSNSQHNIIDVLRITSQMKTSLIIVNGTTILKSFQI